MNADVQHGAVSSEHDDHVRRFDEIPLIVDEMHLIPLLSEPVFYVLVDIYLNAVLRKNSYGFLGIGKIAVAFELCENGSFLRFCHVCHLLSLWICF